MNITGEQIKVNTYTARCISLTHTHTHSLLVMQRTTTAEEGEDKRLLVSIATVEINAVSVTTASYVRKVFYKK